MQERKAPQIHPEYKQEVVRIIPGYKYEQEILSVLPKYLSIQQDLGVEPPFIIMLSFLGVKDYAVVRDNYFGSQPTGDTIDRDSLLVPEVVVENFESDLKEIMRPIFDAIWNAAGWPRSMNYDEHGG